MEFYFSPLAPHGFLPSLSCWSLTKTEGTSQHLYQSFKENQLRQFKLYFAPKWITCTSWFLLGAVSVRRAVFGVCLFTPSVDASKLKLWLSKSWRQVELCCRLVPGLRNARRRLCWEGFKVKSQLLKILPHLFLCMFFFFSDRKAIFFNSHNVSKPESSSDLTTVSPNVTGSYLLWYLSMCCCCTWTFHSWLQRENVEGVSQPPSDDVIRELSRSLRQALGVSLFGIDVIINNQTGQHAVIDVNAFPGRCGRSVVFY